MKYFKGRNVSINDLEGGVNVESDCEGNSIGVGSGTLRKGENRAVLVTGSFSAYVCFPAPP